MPTNRNAYDPTNSYRAALINTMIDFAIETKDFYEINYTELAKLASPKVDEFLQRFRQHEGQALK